MAFPNCEHCHAGRPKISVKKFFLLTEATMDRLGKKDADNAFVKSEIRSMRDASLRACKEPRGGRGGLLREGEGSNLCKASLLGVGNLLSVSCGLVGRLQRRRCKNGPLPLPTCQNIVTRTSLFKLTCDHPPQLRIEFWN